MHLLQRPNGGDRGLRYNSLSVACAAQASEASELRRPSATLERQLMRTSVEMSRAVCSHGRLEGSAHTTVGLISVCPLHESGFLAW